MSQGATEQNNSFALYFTKFRRSNVGTYFRVLVLVFFCAAVIYRSSAI